MRTGPKSRGFRPREEGTDWFLALGAIGVLINLIKLASAWGDRWDTTIPEGSIVYSALAVFRSGQPLYGDFSQFPFTTTPYGPFYYFVLGVISAAFGGSVDAAYGAGRSISFLSWGACLVLSYFLVRQAGGPFRSALFAALMAGTAPIVYPWAASSRPDFFAVAFTLAGFLLIKKDALDAFPIPTLLAWLAAYFIKPSFITGPAVWTLYLLLSRRPQAAVKWMAGFGLSVLAGLLLMEWFSGGLFFPNVFASNAAATSISGARKLLQTKILPSGAVVVLLGVAAAVASWRREAPTAGSVSFVRLLILFAFVSTFLFTLASVKAGADENYFFEPLFGWSLVISFAFDPFRQWLSHRRYRIGIVVVGVLALLTLGFNSRIGGDFKNAISRPGHDKLENMVQGTAGEILFVSNGLGLRLGRGATLHDGYNASYLESLKRIDLAPIAERIEEKEFAGILSLGSGDYYGYSLLPPSLEEPMKRNYRPVARFYPYLWMKARSTSLTPPVSRFPVLSVPPTAALPASHFSQIGIAGFGEKDGTFVFTVNGTLQSKATLPQTGTYQVDLYATSSEYPGVLAQARVSVGDEFTHTFDIQPLLPGRYSARGRLRAGTHPVRVEFLNDHFLWSEQLTWDLNIVLDRLDITAVPEKETVPSVSPKRR